MSAKTIRVEGDVAYVELTKGCVAIIDACDVQIIGGKNWYTSNGYAVRAVTGSDGKQHKELMHRVIANTPFGMETDHINGNRLDNRRSNLRWATKSQNMSNISARSNNRSGLKGASFHKQSGRWTATISVNKKIVHIGIFKTRELAHEAYCEAAKKFHGEFANTGA